MTIIMPAGSKKLEWAPKDESLQKTASTSEQVVEEVNPLYEAAKKVVKAQMEVEVLPPPAEEIAELPAPEAVPTAAPAEAAPAGAVADVAKAVQEVVEKAEKAEAVVEKVEQALDKVQEAAQEAKDTVAECKGEEAKKEEKPEEVAEVEIEVEEEKDEDKEEMVKESKDEPEKKEEKKACMAASEDTFVRFAHISPENRQKLLTYWTKYLKFPKDYVALMVKDYEK